MSRIQQSAGRLTLSFGIEPARREFKAFNSHGNMYYGLEIKETVCQFEDIKQICDPNAGASGR